MLIGIDDITNNVTTLGTFFSMFVYIRTLFCFVLIGGNLTAQFTHEEISKQNNKQSKRNFREKVVQ